MIEPSKKLAKLATSVFSEFAARKQEQLALGADMIDLSIGSPDLPPPDFVRQLLAEEVAKATEYGYTLTATSQFKEAVCHYYLQRYNIKIHEDEVLQLIGSQDGLSHLALAYLDEGDVLISPNPGYPIYHACAEIAGAGLYTVEMREENQFMPDLSSIPDEIKKRAKLMIVNYPGNPTSALATKEYFSELIEFGLKNQILIVHDFAYSELIFDDVKPMSIFTIPNAKQIAIEFNSLSKSFNMAGARIGYLLGAPKFLKPLETLKSHLDYGVFSPIQKAASIALTSDYQFLDKQRKIYEQRRNAFVEALHDCNWQVKKPGGGMFVWAKIPDCYTSFDFSLKALEHGVVVTPGHAFGTAGEGYVRIALVQDEENLVEAAKRLEPFIKGGN